VHSQFWPAALTRVSLSRGLGLKKPATIQGPPAFCIKITSTRFVHSAPSVSSDRLITMDSTRLYLDSTADGTAYAHQNWPDAASSNHSSLCVGSANADRSPRGGLGSDQDDLLRDEALRWESDLGRRRRRTRAICCRRATGNSQKCGA
jgi:hypothetical protein